MVRSIFRLEPKMTNQLFTLSLFALALPILASGHGVERGSVKKAMDSFTMSEAAKAKISLAVHESCEVNNAQKITAIAQLREASVDQGQTDLFFSVSLSVYFENKAEPAIIRVEAAEYAFSNPSVENVEVLSIRSSICR